MCTYSYIILHVNAETCRVDQYGSNSLAYVIIKTARTARSLTGFKSFANLAEICGAPVAFPQKNGEALALLLLDGGMGACPVLCYNNADSPLWSVSVIEKDSTAIIRAHLAYLEAGADIIITNTYV